MKISFALANTMATEAKNILKLGLTDIIYPRYYDRQFYSIALFLVHTEQSETFQTLSIYYTVLGFGIEFKK